MSINDAYLYAKNIRRLHLTNIQLEARMSSEGYSEEDIKLVKSWISHKRVGI